MRKSRSDEPRIWMRKIGQLLIEKEFLEKKYVQLGIDLSERP